MSKHRRFDWDRWQEIVDFARERGHDLMSDEVQRAAHKDPRVTAAFVQRPPAPPDDDDGPPTRGPEIHTRGG